MPPYIPPHARSKKNWSCPSQDPTTKSSGNQTTQSSTSSPSPRSPPIPPTTNSTTTTTTTSSLLRPFARLRPAPIQRDPLEAAGLPSKGDTVLLDHAAQESYYGTLTERYMAWCAATGSANGVLANSRSSAGRTTTARTKSESESKSGPGSASGSGSGSGSAGKDADDDVGQCHDASLGPSHYASGHAPRSDLAARLEGISLDGAPGPASASSPSTTSPNEGLESKHAKEQSTLHMSMRKLREALLATRRTDSFAQQVYLFIVRAAVLSRTFESYHPALLHLLYGIHVSTPLSASIQHEMVGYQILDMACRVGDIGEAYAIRARWGYDDVFVDMALTALVRGDWVGFWRAFAVVNGYQRSLMGWAEGGIRKHAIKCVGSAYRQTSIGFVERTAGGRKWRDLVELDGVEWDVEGETVVIKRVKPGPRPKA